MSKNKGFTFVEIIVVVAIMSILVGGSIMLFKPVKHANAKKCANLIKVALTDVRQDNMTNKDSMYLYIHASGDELYMKKSTNGSDDFSGGKGEPLGKTPLTIVYVDNSGNNVTVDASNMVKVKFNKSTGVLEGNCKTIKIANGDKGYTINIAKNTGKATIK